MMLEDLRAQVTAALTPWAASQGLAELPAYALEEPPSGIEADVACNLALLLAKPLKKSPRALAEELKKHLEGHLPQIEAITIAGAGFLNFRWALGVLQQELRAILKQPAQYGRRPETAKEKVLIEFVSANPTGPLHVGHGRGAALGDSLALIFSHLGYPVTREYYINDAGNQVQLLGESLLARALELEGKPFVMPEQGYQGDYVRDIARDLIAQVTPDKRTLETAIAFALERMQKNIEQDLAVFGVRFDSWFSEASVVKKGLVEKHIELLRKKGFIEEADGAVWFVSPSPQQGDKAHLNSYSAPSPGSLREGARRADEAPHPGSAHPLPVGEKEQQDKNRVLKRKDGRWTYFATDIAYHADKFERGYDRLIDVWGADHHGYVPRVKGSMQALGYDPTKLHVILNQLVSLTRGGAPVTMSKRSGEFVTLRDVVDEVGKDACRFFFAMRGPNTALEFDLELAKKQTADNPVFYLQYAHARICSIFAQANSSPAGGEGSDVLPLHLLKEKEERDLMRRLSLFPQVLMQCVNDDSPHSLANYLLSLARQFHHFYDHHRVLGDDPQMTQARLGLIDAVRQLLKLGLSLLGVSAPEAMFKTTP